MEALVVRLKDTAEFGQIEFGEEDGQPVVTVGAAVKSAALVHEAAQKGFSGVEFLTGVPGTVGGAVACDAGGRFGRVHDVLVGFSGLPFTIEKKDKGLFWLDRARDAESFCVCSAVLRVSPCDSETIEKRIREITGHRRNTQPEGVRSAGCFFRNPPGELSAGKLIDMAGLKGKKRGGAEVSTVHANYIVNTGNATAYDVVGLAVEVAEIVRERFNVKLAFEVDLWGESLEELIAGKGYF
jgi:UDP-N-acetylmuramate dehydrogenase